MRRGQVVAVLIGVAAVLLAAALVLRGGSANAPRGTGFASPPVSSPPVSSPPSAAPSTSAPSPAPGRTVTILGAGDVLPHPAVWQQAAADAGRAGYDFRAIFDAVASDISAADLAVCHLETPLGAPAGPFSGYPLFNVPPQIAVGLRASGFDTCSTASNHTLDAGAAGVYRTLDTLDAAGLRHAGSYRSAAAQQVPNIVEVNGVTVAHLSYADWFNGLRRPAGRLWIANLTNPDAIIAEARRARLVGAEIVVVSLHWGDEYHHRPNGAQVALARRLLAAAEIDLILGSHAHVVQPLEKINDKWVAYGMGNLIARQADGFPARREGVLPRFTFTEVKPGTWRVTTIEAITTWIEFAPKIRIVNLTAALADPDTPAGRRGTYAAAQDRIAGYLGARGAQVVHIGG